MGKVDLVVRRGKEGREILDRREICVYMNEGCSLGAVWCDWWDGLGLGI